MNHQNICMTCPVLKDISGKLSLDSTNRIAAGPNGRMRPDEILKTLRHMFELKKETASNSTQIGQHHHPWTKQIGLLPVHGEGG